MMGIQTGVDANGQNLKGIIPKSVDHIFGYLDNAENSGKNFLIRCAYLEIYNECVLDLLSKFGLNGQTKKQEKNTKGPGEQK